MRQDTPRGERSKQLRTAAWNHIHKSSAAAGGQRRRTSQSSMTFYENRGMLQSQCESTTLGRSALFHAVDLVARVAIVAQKRRPHGLERVEVLRRAFGLGRLLA